MQNYLQSSYDLKHTTSAVKTYMNRKTHNNKLSVTGWPLQSSDLGFSEALKSSECASMSLDTIPEDWQR